MGSSVPRPSTENKDGGEPNRYADRERDRSHGPCVVAMPRERHVGRGGMAALTSVHKKKAPVHRKKRADRKEHRGQQTPDSSHRSAACIC